jgi:hypothetical protein
MHATTLSEIDKRIEYVVQFAVSRIQTKTELDRFLLATEHMRNETTNEDLREMLVEIWERVFVECLPCLTTNPIHASFAARKPGARDSAARNAMTASTDN